MRGGPQRQGGRGADASELRKRHASWRTLHQQAGSSVHDTRAGAHATQDRIRTGCASDSARYTRQDTDRMGWGSSVDGTRAGAHATPAGERARRGVVGRLNRKSIYFTGRGVGVVIRVVRFFDRWMVAYSRPAFRRSAFTGRSRRAATTTLGRLGGESSIEKSVFLPNEPN